MPASQADVDELLTELVDDRFPAWRARAVLTAGRLARELAGQSRQELRDRCGDLHAEVRQARRQLDLALIQLPTLSSEQSRLVDVKKAFDQLEATLAGLEQERSGGSQ